MAITIERIKTLFERHGSRAYDGEGVTQVEHALQCAALAEQGGADAALVTACLLHDLGHLLNDCGATPTLRGIDDRHQYFVVPFLRGVFGDAVIEPIRLHVDAKRYLAATEPDYLARLSPDSLRSLQLQGGVFTAEEARRFRARPFAQQAVQLRRFDDLAKCAGRPTPSLDYFLAVARTVARRIR